MKSKIVLAAIAALPLTVFAGATQPPTTLPEPSTLALFAAAIVAVAVLSRLKK